MLVVGFEFDALLLTDKTFFSVSALSLFYRWFSTLARFSFVLCTFTARTSAGCSLFCLKTETDFSPELFSHYNNHFPPGSVFSPFQHVFFFLWLIPPGFTTVISLHSWKDSLTNIGNVINDSFILDTGIQKMNGSTEVAWVNDLFLKSHWS